MEACVCVCAAARTRQYLIMQMARFAKLRIVVPLFYGWQKINHFNIETLHTQKT